MMTIVWFMIALGILVNFHEYGHFIVARWFGVKVKRFSFGFGPVLASVKDRHNTEFAFSALPLGGYVAFDDEPETQGTQATSDTLGSKPHWQRALIYLAGPIANFLLAIVFFAVLALIGQQQFKPVVGQVIDGSAAQTAGVKPKDIILAVDGQQTDNWDQVYRSLFERVGHTGEVTLTLAPFDEVSHSAVNSLERTVRFPIERWLSTEDTPNTVKDLGISIFPETSLVTIGLVERDGPAAQAGLATGDQLVSLEGQAIEGWASFVNQVQSNPDQALSLEILRDGATKNIILTPRDNQGQGFVGIGPERALPPAYQYREQASIWQAIPQGVRMTWDQSKVVLISIKKLFQQELSIKNLSGPITIAKVAGDTAERGFVYFLNFLAVLSVSLAVFNLLPIPMLDGGRLVMLGIERIKGSPVSEHAQGAMFFMGLLMVGSMMLIASYYDILRIL